MDLINIYRASASDETLNDMVKLTNTKINLTQKKRETYARLSALYMNKSFGGLTLLLLKDQNWFINVFLSLKKIIGSR